MQNKKNPLEQSGLYINIDILLKSLISANPDHGTTEAEIFF
jgi:hypothetical protein